MSDNDNSIYIKENDTIMSSGINEQGIQYKCIIKDNNEYKTVKGNNLISLGTSFPSTEVFESNYMSNINDLLYSSDGGLTKIIDQLSDNFEIIVSSDVNVNDFRFTISPKPTIIIPTGDIMIGDFLRLLKVDLVTEGTGIIKLACSFDKGSTWETYKDKWSNIVLDNESMKQDGIESTTLGSLPNSAWDRTMDTSTLRIAYYIENPTISDNIGANTLKITGELLGGWKRAKNNKDYSYKYNSNISITVNLLNDGTYKINYYKK